MSLSKLSMRAIVFAVCVIFLGVAAHAQYRASIQGVVTDAQGAVVSNATVTLQNEETGQTSKATTGSDGIFNFTGLPPSKFTLTAEKTGFKTKTIRGFGVVAEQANSVNLQLDLGAVTESVTVNGNEMPLLDTESANLGGSVQAKDFQNLPSFGRDPFQLLQLAPGAFGDGAQFGGGGTYNLPSSSMGGAGATDGIFKIENGGQITANGARAGDNNYTIDGVGTTSVSWGGSSVITPNEDSIKEIRVVTDNYDAENGRYRGAQVQIISQNGTNQYHGSILLKVHRPGLNAFTRYNGYGNANVRDDNRFNDWAGTVGGPIVKNRLFAFFSYERIDNGAQQGSGGNWFETPQFRQLTAAAPNAAKYFAFPGVGPNGGKQITVLNGQPLDCAFLGLVDLAHATATKPANCNEVSGGLNLGQPLNPAMFAVGQRDPGYTGNSQPGTGGDGSGGANNLTSTPDIAFYTTVEPSTSSHVQYNGRLDFNATSKDLLTFSMYYVPNSSTGINNGNNGDRSMNLFNSTYYNRALTALWDHTFNSTMTNEARVNAAGWLEKDLSTNPSAPWGLPVIGFNFGVSGYGIGSFNGFDQWTYAAKDVLTKVHGAHTMKMGGEFTRLLFVDAPFWADRPSYTFNNIWDFLNDAPIQESAQFDPQTGVPSTLRKDVRANLWGLFYQDNYKMRPNLTLTAGLRWEYFGADSEKNSKLATVVLGTGANLFSGLRVRTGGHEFNPQKANFGPQLGFSWSPKQLIGHEFGSRLVIRGGFGIAYNGLKESNTLDTRFNPPFVDNGLTLSGSQIIYSNSFPSNVHSPNGYASNPNAVLTFGSNNLPLPSCLTPTSTSGCLSLTALPANLPTTRTSHYTIGAEYDLGHQWVASLGYQGSTTRHLTEHYNLYDVGAADNIPLNPIVAGITYYANDGSARFNALLAELKHTFSQSFSIDTQYRFSHTMDSGSNAYAGPIYQWNLATLFATSDYDVRHAFKVYGTYTPRLFRGSRSRMEKVAGGWQVSGILNAHTGFPWTPQYWDGSTHAITGGSDPVFSFGNGAQGSSSNTGSQNFLPTKYLGGFTPNYRGNGNGNGTAFFTPPTSVPGTLFPCLFPNPPAALCPSGQQGFGPLPSAPGIARNSFTGPGYFDIDATLGKSFGLPTMKVLGEGAKFEIRANFYNLFNKLNMQGQSDGPFPWSTGVQSDISSAHFGESNHALGARVIEMQARFSF